MSSRAGERGWKVLLLADSLCMPREDEDNQGPILPHQTYGSLLEARASELGWQVTVDAERARTIIDVNGGLGGWLRGLAPSDVVIIQVGVVDCAPRVLTAAEHRLLEKLRPRWLQKVILRFIHHYRARLVRMRRHVYVPLPLFEQLFAQTLRLLVASGARKVGVVAIAPTLPQVTERSPGFAENIELYSESLRALCEREGASFIDPIAGQPATALPTLIRRDGHHLTVEGNALYADALMFWLAGITG